MRWGGGRLLEDEHKKGLPIGNLTSQIFANIYLNELDQFIKHTLRIHHYFRYADDFAIVHKDPIYLEYVQNSIAAFLDSELSLALHPDKVEIRKFNQGIDFLGYIILPHYILLRTKTKRRMMKKLNIKHYSLLHGKIEPYAYNQSLQSYLGLIQHSDSYSLEGLVKNNFSLPGQ